MYARSNVRRRASLKGSAADAVNGMAPDAASVVVDALVKSVSRQVLVLLQSIQAKRSGADRATRRGSGSWHRQSQSQSQSVRS